MPARIPPYVVITAGTAIREAVGIIKAAGGVPVGIVTALDRQERGQGPKSAVQEVRVSFSMYDSAACTPCKRAYLCECISFALCISRATGYA